MAAEGLEGDGAGKKSDEQLSGVREWCRILTAATGRGIASI